MVAPTAAKSEELVKQQGEDPRKADLSLERLSAPQDPTDRKEEFLRRIARKITGVSHVDTEGVLGENGMKIGSALASTETTQLRAGEAGRVAQTVDSFFAPQGVGNDPSEAILKRIYNELRAPNPALSSHLFSPQGGSPDTTEEFLGGIAIEVGRKVAEQAPSNISSHVFTERALGGKGMEAGKKVSEQASLGALNTKGLDGALEKIERSLIPAIALIESLGKLEAVGLYDPKAAPEHRFDPMFEFLKHTSDNADKILLLSAEERKVFLDKAKAVSEYMKALNLSKSGKDNRPAG